MHRVFKSTTYALVTFGLVGLFTLGCTKSEKEVHSGVESNLETDSLPTMVVRHAENGDVQYAMVDQAAESQAEIEERVANGELEFSDLQETSKASPQSNDQGFYFSEFDWNPTEADSERSFWFGFGYNYYRPYYRYSGHSYYYSSHWNWSYSYSYRRYNYFYWYW